MLILVALFAGIGLLLVAYALTTRGRSKTTARRIETIKARHADDHSVEVQLKRIAAARGTRFDATFHRLIPNPDLLRRKIEMTGRSWTLGQYSTGCAIIAVLTWVLLAVRGAAAADAAARHLRGPGLPYMAIGKLAKKRVAKFVVRFPDAIELLVRGLRSGLPISETIGVVGAEIQEPVGSEFRAVADKMRIGKTMEQALQETANRIGTPEIQFFVITLAIQRETGGNLAETLSNLAEVLRKRMQMKLKVKAMSSESKASAYIIGSLPFIVFGLIFYINPTYMSTFFTDHRLIMALPAAASGWASACSSWPR